MAISDITVLDPADAAAPVGSLSAAVGGPHDVLLSGPDALVRWDVTVAQRDLVLAVWADPSLPIVLYDDDLDSLEERLRTGTVVLVAGTGTIDPLARQPAPSAAQPWFGSDALLVHLEPGEAAARLTGSGQDLALSGLTVAVLAAAGSGLGGHLTQAGAGAVACLTMHDEALLPRSGLLTRAAFTRRLGSFQYRVADEADAASGATLLGGAPARRRAAALFAGDDPFDIAVVDDRSHGAIGELTALAVDGEMAVAVEELQRPVVVLRGTAARVAQTRLDGASEGESLAVSGEDRDRYLAHQWASAMRRAADAKRGRLNVGGPTLASEAAAVGLVAPVPSGRTVDGTVVARLAAARGWHRIDPDLPPVLDPVLEAARRQAGGDDVPIPADDLAALAARAERPGFWPDLLSSTRVLRDGVLVFPYPAPAVELLRAAVAADGDARELRRLLGPVKVAVFEAFSGGGS